MRRMVLNCKNIQEIILTDYIDGHVRDKQKELIDQHLAYCTVCKELLVSIKKQVIYPFNTIRRVVPDESLWVQIKQTIQEEERQLLVRNLSPNFWEKLRSAVYIPRPAVALGTIMTMIFMIGTAGQFFINSQSIKINGQDQVQYISSLIDEPVDLPNNNGNDVQSPIEKYFL